MPATAADLPPELFPLILDYLRTDNRGYEEYIRDVWVRDMMSCSLVCLYWANRCREYLFRGHEVVIKSLAEFFDTGVICDGWVHTCTVGLTGQVNFEI